MIKPNRDELGQIFGRKLADRKDILECAGKLQRRGARNVLVSLAEDGAVLLSEDGKIFEAPAPAGSASAFSDHLAEADEIERLMGEVEGRRNLDFFTNFPETISDIYNTKP